MKPTTTLLLLFWLIVGNAAMAQTPVYHEVKAQKGDGIIRLLMRYQLENHKCNVEEFCRINKLKQNSALIADKAYKLPIFAYTYNGTSIRGSIDNQDLVLAKSIERYNDFMLQKGLRSTDFRAKNATLYVPYHLLKCPTDVSVFVPTKRVFPIFGTDYQKTPLQDKKLAGAVYYLIAGHGGPDSGAQGTYKDNTICEDEYAYDITLRLARNLLEHGAMVYMIVRDTNDGIRNDEILKCNFSEFCYPNKIIPVPQKERLTQRTDAINELYDKNRKLGADYQAVVELHIDSRTQHQRMDVYFYHYLGDALGRDLAHTLQAKLAEKYAIHRASGDYGGTVSERDLHTLRESKPLSVFIELGNIQNPNDQKRFVLADNRQALANWLAEGLMEHY